jgi:hypothetical protein
MTASYAAALTLLAAWLMVSAGVSKSQLTWRPRRQWRWRRPRRRRPLR